VRILLTLPFDRSHHRMSPDLGLGYLAAVLRQQGHSVELLLSLQRFTSPDAFVAHVRQGSYDLIGLKTFSCQILATRETLSLIRRAAPDATIVLGGAHVSADPEHAFAFFPQADYAVQGEAERGLSALARALDEDRLPAAEPTVPGLIWRDGETTRVNALGLVDDLDSLPLPAWDLMPPAEFPDLPFNGYSRRHPIAPMILTRGCPFRCTFCGAGIMNGHRVRTRSAENVMAEIRLLTQEYGVREIQFYDSNCAHRAGPLRQVLQQIIDEGIDITWCAPNGIRLDSVDAELVRLMKDSGCFQVNVGIESGSPRILKQIRKGITPDLARRAVRLLRAGGLEVVGFFMMGFPGETRDEIRQTIRLALELPLTGASFSIYSPLPGTEDYRQLWKDGHPDLDAVNALDFVSYENNLSEVPARELRAMQRLAYLRFHLRPPVLRSFIRNLNSLAKIRLVGQQAWQKLLSR
jgi:radical SAM superfamily enzyme YgiQ (UPF0313 family)